MYLILLIYIILSLLNYIICLIILYTEKYEHESDFSMLTSHIILGFFSIPLIILQLLNQYGNK